MQRAGDTRKRLLGTSGVEPGGQEASGRGSKKRLLESLSGVAAGFRAAGSAKGDHAAKGKPLAATRSAKETAAIAERGRGRWLDLVWLQGTPDCFELCGQPRLEIPNGVGAPRENRGATSPSRTIASEFS